MNTIKINKNIVKTSNTDNNLYNHNGICVEIYPDEKFTDNKTVENYIAEVIDAIDALNNLVEYKIEIENCVIKNFEIITSEDLYETICDRIDILNKKYNCNFYYDCSLCCSASPEVRQSLL